MSWDVIYWDDRKYVDYVPSCWSDGGTNYKFPKHCSKSLLEKLIESCDPLTKYKFKWYVAEVKYKNVKLLEEAKNICARAEETSTLEADETDGSTSDESEEQNENNHQDIIIQKPHSLCRILSSNIQTSASNCAGENRSKSVVINKNIYPQGKIRQESQIVNNSHVSETAIHKVTCQNLNSTPAPISIEENNQHNVNLTAGELFLSKKLSGIMFELKEINKRFDSLEQKLLTKAVLAESSYDSTPEILKMLPCKENENLLTINNMIQNDEQMHILVECLYLCGGETYYKSIFLQMKRLLSKNVALLYSGEGKKGKLSFKKLKVYDALTRAVRKRFPNVTESEIKKSVSFFLAGSKDREGGRKLRTAVEGT